MVAGCTNSWVCTSRHLRVHLCYSASAGTGLRRVALPRFVGPSHCIFYPGRGHGLLVLGGTPCVAWPFAWRPRLRGAGACSNAFRRPCRALCPPGPRHFVVRRVLRCTHVQQLRGGIPVYAVPSRVAMGPSLHERVASAAVCVHRACGGVCCHAANCGAAVGAIICTLPVV